ncbi:uncharacterized protein TNIN_421791 [Trichonephila inaurata madagascariensis]|uniref:Peptidase A2 domain-containing protein n=1 Tax=Trichonephila inaurata madagascariensis TaxID=2747483 RepID=A0A8X6YER3_9ARAC|nr:uncharacterized protein TNIN_421791 [Trichonephila inaurata madagascariensis]
MRQRTPERRNNFRPRNRSRNRSFSRSRDSGFCWYHRKFQERAKKYKSSNIAFLIDTGSDVSVLPASISEKRKGNSIQQLTAANTSAINVYGKGRIAELRYIAKQLGEKVTDDLKIIDLKNLIVNSPNYEEEFVREMLNMIIEKRLKTSTSRVSKYFDLNERYILSTYEFETLFKLKKHNSSNINKVNSKSENVSLDPYTIRSKENGVVMPVLRETGASLDKGFEKCAAPEMFTGEQGLVKHIHDDTMTCLQPAERKFECEPMHVVLKPIVSPIHLDREKYILEDQTVELLEPDLEQNGLSRPEIGNEIPTRRQRRKEAEKRTRLENVDDQFRLRECVVENGEDFVPSFLGEGTDNGNLVKLSDCEVMEAQLRNLVKLSDCEVMEAQLRNLVKLSNYEVMEAQLRNERNQPP